MKTIRENTYDLLLKALVGKGLLGADRASSLATQILERLVERGWKADDNGSADSVILLTRRGVTTLFYRPVDVRVVWVDFDAVRAEGVDGVEVF